jgi:uncharacterized damage-inducible protein DinB
MANLDHRAYLVGLLDQAAHLYCKDLAALGDEAAEGASPRAAVDFTHEVAVVNRRIAARLRGDDPGEWPFQEWAVAPEELRSAEAAEGEIRSSVAELKEAMDGMTDAQLIEKRDIAGKETTPFEQIVFAGFHMSYHMGQLNYIQQLGGDMAVHWD